MQSRLSSIMLRKTAFLCMRNRLTWVAIAFILATSFTYLLFTGSAGSGNILAIFERQRTTGSMALQPSSSKTICRFPSVNPFDPNIVKLSGTHKTLRCDHDFLPEITKVNGLTIVVNTSLVNKKTGFSHCHMRNVSRPLFKDNSAAFSEWSKPFDKFINITDEHEFLHVECFGSDKKTVVSKAFYSLVPKRKHLDALYDVRIAKRKIKFKPKDTLNIIFVALDGLPRHQILRGMPKTYKYITETLNAFDFTMHQQIADNTFPNLLALLSGNDATETGRWWNFKKPQDAFELIWHDFERAGFRTLYSEDNPDGAGFYWGRRSFIYPQTTYWNRPLELAMLKEKGFIRRKSACAGPRPISEYQLEYLTRFLEMFKDKPVACGTFIINLTHDDSSNAGLIDEHIYNSFQDLKGKGHMNRSLVMFFSDHGNRWGEIRKTYNGVLESRNPFLFLMFPNWFLKKYPDVAKNLKTNTHRLTSHFDTNQMLLDLIYFRSKVATPLYRGRHGLSLFGEIPEDRTCHAAGVPASQCLCGQKVEKFLSTTSELATKLSSALLEAVKAKSDKEQCEVYTLGKIMQVGSLSMPTASKAEKKRYHVLRVRITVNPGNAMFEGSVSLDNVTGRTSVGDNIERLNMYKGEVECQPTSRTQMYCYCKGNKARPSWNMTGIVQLFS